MTSRASPTGTSSRRRARTGSPSTRRRTGSRSWGPRRRSPSMAWPRSSTRAARARPPRKRTSRSATRCAWTRSPDNTTGFKGAPSPLWTLVGLKDPTLGTETCGGGGTTGECQTALPAGGADVEFTYKITNTGTTTVSDLAVEDDKLGIIDASQIVPLDPGQSGTLTTKQFVASTTRNTV